jgi:hypothetical protein
MIQQDALEVRIITLNTKRCSVRQIDDGGDRSFADSGELLQRGTVKYSRLRPLLDAKFIPDD